MVGGSRKRHEIHSFCIIDYGLERGHIEFKASTVALFMRELPLNSIQVYIYIAVGVVNIHNANHWGFSGGAGSG